MIRRISLLCVGALLLAFLAGCAAEDAIDRAAAAIDQAQQVHAEYLAPYEFTSAEQYLAEARKQLNESDFDAAQAYADAAYQKALKAAEIARGKHALPMVPWSATQPAPYEPETAAPEGGAQ